MRHIFAVFIVVLVTSTHTVYGKKAPDCTQCNNISKNFVKGLEKTAKSNYGGGNTNWEEKSLGKYAKSEVRFVEIMDEHLCSDNSKECHHMKEEFEDEIEAFWFQVFSKQDSMPDFHKWFCIDKIKACCAANHYGPKCFKCEGGVSKPCFGNGNCDGEGTRTGTGTCTCNAGYTGDVCDECSDGYFEDVKNDTHTICKPCHISCKKMCWESGPKGCDECKDGWTTSEELGCLDVDECAVAESPCSFGRYCVNTQGSYSCFGCDVACDGCEGSGANNCNKCQPGFYLDGQTCLDDDECSIDEKLCTEINEKCVNNPGSYSCECESGFTRQDGKCKPAPKEAKEEEEEESDDDDDGDDDVEDDNQDKNIPLPSLPPRMEL